ncbi:MAG: UPF0149 family protein [Gammaproteobacteria bacterium]|nr:UPF0149 family protein [Gammaproteobacteria bacterium]
MSGEHHVFDLAEARRLQALFARRTAREAMGYHELAGFLFAVAAAPATVQPSEWLDLLLEDDPPLFTETKLCEEALPLLLALHGVIERGIDDDAPALPPDCAPRPGGRANLAADAPLSLWSRGFLDGHDWLSSLWEAEMDEAFDAALEAAIVALGFFAAPGLAADFHREYGAPDEALEDMAARLAAAVPAALATYVELARELGDALGEEDGEA